ncbi:RagB/SusD family nutrient uptake outer membrane protein [uncultured Algibacter sp.]|uniref:RagB/SusD family nutrient uptake outer membrane protein n=1 Tax=uncultured Algibacter sp. TaxID=298659 RepID=UPI00261B08BB|nr:RagB/SusD family nutrient uptake outer membrane protein [uncultured Algibacter sp.]
MFKIRNKIKNIKYWYVIALAALCFVGCVDIDEISDLTDVSVQGGTAESPFTVKLLNDFTLLVYSDYWPMLFLNGYNVPGWGGDDITTSAGGSKEEFRQFDIRELVAANPRTEKYWRDTNVILASAGRAVVFAEGFLSTVPDSDKDVDSIVRTNELLGELLFLRSVSFHQTLRIFGKAALTVTQETPATELSGPEEVYTQIEQDLLTAIENLPDIQEGVQGAQRPNKGSARALLARVYMDWAGFPLKDSSKYALAAEQARLVIENKAAHGFDLMPHFADLWREANRFNEESCFLFAFDKASGQDNRKYGQAGFPAGPPFNGWDETFAEIRFFEDFPEGPRKEGTFRTEIDWENLQTQASPVYAKVAGPEGDLAFGAFSTERSDFWIRYADVLLMYAEASARSGQITPLSWESLNQVRRRAADLPFNTPDASVDITSGDLAQLAVTERKWELAGEWLRWFDLVRLELVAEALATPARTPQSSTNSDGELLPLHNPATGDLSNANYFSKIPPAILDENPGFVDE